jgi:hypothetical protein
MLSFTENELRIGITEIGIIDYLIHLNPGDMIEVDEKIYYFNHMDDLSDFKIFFFDDGEKQYESWFSFIYDNNKLYINQTSWECLGEGDLW